MTTVAWIIEWKNKSIVDLNVVNCGWRCTSTNGTYEGLAYGVCSFSLPNDVTTPIEDLTQDQILNWCWNNGVDKNIVEKNVTAQVKSQQQ